MKWMGYSCIAFLLLLCFTGVVTLISSANYDTKWSGDGTSEHPYEIASAAQLADLAANVYGGNDYAGKYFKLTNSTPGAYDLGAHIWYPIGTIDSPFKGTFDGNNCTISNMNIRGDYNSGLFGCVQHAQIRNVGVLSVNVLSSCSNCSAGALVGYAWFSNITNCWATGTVNSHEHAGGLVGETGYSNITNCYATGTVTGSNTAGGLVGEAWFSNITNCCATGTVNADYIGGGLVGWDYSSDITHCYATGTVNADYDGGGLVGYAGDGSITNCYATGTVKSNEYAGGLVGYAGNSSIKNCYATGTVIVNYGNTTAGGLVGHIYKGSITNSVALNQWVSQNRLGFTNIGRFIGVSEETELTNNYAWNGMRTNREWTYKYGISHDDIWENRDFFRNTLGWDLGHTWIMGKHNDYRLPLLAGQPADSVPGDVTYLRS